MLLAIEPEPKTLAKLYHVYGPDYKVSKLVVGLMSFTISCIISPQLFTELVWFKILFSNTDIAVKKNLR